MRNHFRKIHVIAGLSSVPGGRAVASKVASGGARQRTGAAARDRSSPLSAHPPIPLFPATPAAPSSTTFPDTTVARSRVSGQKRAVSAWIVDAITLANLQF